MLMRGQAYKVFLDLEMPPSPTNEKLGKCQQYCSFDFPLLQIMQ
jgi:hypothetical protein